MTMMTSGFVDVTRSVMRWKKATIACIANDAVKRRIHPRWIGCIT